MTADEIGRLLEPYLEPGGGDIDRAVVWGQLAIYLELILKWNARINLTAIREPEEIVRRHFGESLFAGLRLGDCGTLLDYGSGAGFPGVPIQLVRPDVAVTLAESQGRKAAFLREVVRSLGVRTDVWGRRVEAMPEERRFDAVVLRAVDEMGAALNEGGRRAKAKVLVLGTMGAPVEIEGFWVEEAVRVPGTESGVLWVSRRG